MTGSVRRTQQTHTPRNAVCVGDHPCTQSLALKGVKHSTTLVFSQAAPASLVSQSSSTTKTKQKLRIIIKNQLKNRLQLIQGDIRYIVSDFF